MIDFIKYRWACAVFTIVLFAASIGAYFYKVNTRGYAFTYSVDFTGGAQALLRFSEPVSSIKLREILEHNGWANPVTREFSANEVLVRVKIDDKIATDAKDVGEKMRTVIAQELPGNSVSILQSEVVGPGVGEALRWNSILAVIIALISILVYIAVRFRSMSFAVGAVVALAHDAFIMLAAFLIFDREISIVVIGAVLAVLGYSINDTIVIFARIRDNLTKMRGAPIQEIVNVSINQTLRRTLLTSFFTALSVVAMLVLGGEALRDFSLALLVGIVFGTYSSIYIASPIMMLLYKEKQR